MNHFHKLEESSTLAMQIKPPLNSSNSFEEVEVEVAAAVAAVPPTI